MRRLSISEARNHLTQLAEELQKDPGAIEVTNRGNPVLAILPWDIYEAMEETVEILGDERLQRSLQNSLREMREGKLIPWEKVKKDLGLK